MPKDTNWISYDEKTFLLRFYSESAVNSEQFYKTTELIGDDVTTAYAYNGQQDPRKDSILKIIMLNDINVYNTNIKNKNENFVEYGFIFFIMIIISLVLRYAIRKKREYIANPAAAEAKEEWEEIGTSNNYDTTGAGGIDFDL